MDGCFYFISLSGQVLKCIAKIARSPLQLVPMKQLLWLLYAICFPMQLSMCEL